MDMELVNALREVVREEIQPLEAKMSSMETKMDSMESDLAEVKTKVNGIELTIENDIKPGIKVIGENTVVARDEVIAMRDDIKYLKDEQKILNAMYGITPDMVSPGE